MSSGELALDEAKSNLQSRGFNVNALGASHTEFLSSLLIEFQDHSYPDVATWSRLHELIKDGAVEKMRPIIPFLKKWIDRFEAKLGMYDLRRSAAIMSLIQSAKINGYDPYLYLKDVLERLPTHKNHLFHELLPHRWQPKQ